ncbi:hypothetical protein RJ55_04599 [Drechmeria coniospora]|nr:hypothetical protein RJ55_04599 [Drechmeria coniospora]
MRRLGFSNEAISRETGLTIHQVQYGATHAIEPIKRSGRRSVLTEKQIEELVVFVCSSKEARQLPYDQLPKALGWSVGHYCIRYALRKRGYNRYVACTKPPISETLRVLRLEWAVKHRSWTPDQWDRALWSDETSFQSGRHTRTWVTRKAEEEANPTCIVEQTAPKAGSTFWACFSGKTGKGPCHFWEKEWSSVDENDYCDQIVPLLDGWVRKHPHLQLVGNDEPVATASRTKQLLQNRGIESCSAPWLAHSPDLNPIEHVWNTMKDWVQQNHPQDKMGRELFQQVVKEAWGAIAESYLRDLVASMPVRCEAVIAANGMHTKY